MKAEQLGEPMNRPTHETWQALIPDVVLLDGGIARREEANSVNTARLAAELWEEYRTMTGVYSNISEIVGLCGGRDRWRIAMDNLRGRINDVWNLRQGMGWIDA